MTQLVSPRLIRGLNTTYLSNVLQGDLDSTEKLTALQAEISRGGTFVWDRTVNIPDRTIGRGAGLLNISGLSTLCSEKEISIDMSMMPNSGSPRYAIVTSDGDQPAAPLTADAPFGQPFISIGATAVATLGLARGQFVSVTSNKVFINGGSPGLENQGERAKITQIVGGLVYLSISLRDTYLMSDGATLRRVIMQERVTIDGFNIRGCGSFTTDTIGDRGFHLIHMDQLRMIDCSTEFCDNGNFLYSSSGVVDGFSYQFDLQPAIPRASNQYGFAYANACQDLTIQNTVGIGGKHGIVQTESGFVNGVSRRVRVRRNTLSQTWNYSIAQHTNSEFLYIEENDLYDNNGGIEFGCKDIYSRDNQIFGTPDDINQGIGINVSDIADNINSTGDKVYGGRFGFRLNERLPLFAGSQGPRNINLMDFFCTDASVAAVSIKSNHVGTKENIHITRPTTRRTGNSSTGVTAALSVDISGNWEKVTVQGGDLQSISGNTAACIRTAGVQDAHVTDNLYSGHGAPIIGGAAGANLVTRNNETY